MGHYRVAMTSPTQSRHFNTILGILTALILAAVVLIAAPDAASAGQKSLLAAPAVRQVQVSQAKDSEYGDAEDDKDEAAADDAEDDKDEAAADAAEDDKDEAAADDAEDDKDEAAADDEEDDEEAGAADEEDAEQPDTAADDDAAEGEDEPTAAADEGAEEGEEGEATAVDDEENEEKEETAGEGEEDAAAAAREAHDDLFAEDRYPSASTCLSCHPKQYREWSVSQHAYSQLSPVYLALSNTLNMLTSGTMGDFCLRCHNQVGSNLAESPFVSNLERHPTSREGITCVVCHRTDRAYNKVSGRVGLVEGGLLQPVYGPTGGTELKRVLANRDVYPVVTEPDQRGLTIHTDAKEFTAISSPTFCGSCHDVTLFNGFRLEEAFSEYRISPAAKKGVTCQDCHMGKVQGVASGYEHGPAAMVNGQPTRDRKITSHIFSGPDYPIIHPGIFPHNGEAQELATLEEWLQFDYKAGWGTQEFEAKVTPDQAFPERWASIDDREDARAILNAQFELLELGRQKRLEVLRNGFHLGEVVVDRADSGGIDLKVMVMNATDGHNVPTGFTGERLIWLQVTVTDGEGKVVYQSGDTDPNGDVRDMESSYVHAGELPLDRHLFNLQSRFLVQNGRGGERERVIPIPYPISALPFVRPSTTSLILTAEPPTERNHKKGIEPLGHRWASYSVDGDAMTGKGPYRANVKLRAQMIPINLVAAIQGVGFDYNMSAREVADAVVAGGEILWEKNVDIALTQ